MLLYEHRKQRGAHNINVICTESTADGDNLFGVDSKNTYNFIVKLERFAFDEAEYYGGFQYNINLAICNASFTEPYNPNTLPVITRDDVLSVTDEVKLAIQTLLDEDEFDGSAAKIKLQRI